MCTVGGSSIRTPSDSSPFIVIASVLGVAALGLLIASLIVQSQALFIALAASIVVLWAVSTLRHALDGTVEAPLRRATQGQY
jgi:hypothetical protein